MYVREARGPLRRSANNATDMLLTYAERSCGPAADGDGAAAEGKGLFALPFMRRAAEQQRATATEDAASLLRSIEAEVRPSPYPKHVITTSKVAGSISAFISKSAAGLCTSTTAPACQLVLQSIFFSSLQMCSSSEWPVSQVAGVPEDDLQQDGQQEAAQGRFSFGAGAGFGQNGATTSAAESRWEAGKLH